MHESLFGIGLDASEHRVEGGAFPDSAKFRPTRYAVQINRHDLSGQGAKGIPIPSPQNVSAVVDGELPSGRVTRGELALRTRRESL